MNTDPFAEIEIDAPATASPQGQRITSIELDPIREKFYDMRGLASNNPDEWNSSKLFYKQGKFMEHFEDDYNRIVPLAMYSPSYQRMGYEQLRTYFTWRAKARRGEVLKTSLSYVFLHIYELLSGIGTIDPIDGLNKLISLWMEYRKHATALDDYMPEWLRDYHVYYPLPHSFDDFAETHELHRHFPETTMFNAEAVLPNWLALGNYDISKSKFYNDGNKELMEAAFKAAVSRTATLCEACGNSLIDLFYHKGETMQWRPFEGALFYRTDKQANRTVQLSAHEVYTCNNGRWTTRRITPYKHKSEFAAWFVKTVELHLRQVMGFSGNFPVGTGKLGIAPNVLQSMNMSLMGLSAVLQGIVREVYQGSTRVVVTVDGRNLERIREEAEVTQEKLIVEDDPGSVHAVSLKYNRHSGLDPESNPLKQIPGQARNDGTFTIAHSYVPESNPLKQAPGQAPNNEAFAITHSSPNFNSTLTQTELTALKIILTSPEAIKPFADENNIMLEILLDGINEKAMDTIGDNVLELCDNEIIIYDEYLQTITEAVTE